MTPIVAIAPLLLIYLPQPLAVLACAWIVAFFPVLANTTLGLNSVDHNLLALFDLYKASRWQVLVESETAGGAAAYARRPAHRRRPVADRRGGRGNRRGLGRRRLGARLPHCRVRLSAQHPAHVRGLLLLSLAGVAIFFLLSAISHLAVAPLARERDRARALIASPLNR